MGKAIQTAIVKVMGTLDPSVAKSVAEANKKFSGMALLLQVLLLQVRQLLLLLLGKHHLTPPQSLKLECQMLRHFLTVILLL